MHKNICILVSKTTVGAYYIHIMSYLANVSYYEIIVFCKLIECPKTYRFQNHSHSYRLCVLQLMLVWVKYCMLRTIMDGVL